MLLPTTLLFPSEAVPGTGFFVYPVVVSLAGRDFFPSFGTMIPARHRCFLFAGFNRFQQSWGTWPDFVGTTTKTSGRGGRPWFAVESQLQEIARRVLAALGFVCPLAAVYIAACPATALAQGQELPAIQVIANTPLQGSGVDRDKIPPSTTYSVDAADFQRKDSPNVTDTLFQRIPGVTLSDPNGNGVQQEIRYRGFAASPLSGHAARPAVYMNGIRINESVRRYRQLGLIDHAIQRADVSPAIHLRPERARRRHQHANEERFTWQGFEQELQADRTRALKRQAIRRADGKLEHLYRGAGHA